MKRSGAAIFQGKCAGHIPGVDINSRFYARAELACLGMHAPPVAGIDVASGARTGVDADGEPIQAASGEGAGWRDLG
jgi:euchromatic histone-lysine N-methyltransferase